MRKSSKYYFLFVLLSFVVFIVAFFISTDLGSSLKYSNDSIWIRRLAINFSLGRGLVGPDGEELIYWVPLYPILLSFWSNHINHFALIINFFSINGVFLIANHTFLKEQKMVSGKLFYTTSLLLSTPLLMISVFLWTETLFLFLLLTFIYGLSNYIDNQKKSYLIIWIISGWLMLLLRNAGIFFIPGIFLWIAIKKDRTWSNKMTFMVQILFMCSGFLTWNIYKIIIKSNLNVLQELIPTFEPLHNFFLISNEIGMYIIPDFGFYISSSVGVGLLFYIIYKAIKYQSRLIGLVYFMILTYLVMFVIVPPDPYEISRYLAPTVPFILIESSRIMSYLLSRRINLVLRWLTIIGIYSYFIIRIFKNSTMWGQLDFYNFFTYTKPLVLHFN